MQEAGPHQTGAILTDLRTATVPVLPAGAVAHHCWRGRPRACTRTMQAVWRDARPGPGQAPNQAARAAWFGA
ncbi:hypothetical protein ACEN88_28370 [Massilia sp. CT11-108]|uniref:hypothetical protein n=1 Tax=Massilia sp. CT11-108 TaxID=3393900 RepID=UPI0039A6918D